MAVCSIDSDRVAEGVKHAFAFFPFVIPMAFHDSIFNNGKFCEAKAFRNLSSRQLLCNMVCRAITALTGQQTSTHANSMHNQAVSFSSEHGVDISPSLQMQMPPFYSECKTL